MSEWQGDRRGRPRRSPQTTAGVALTAAKPSRFYRRERVAVLCLSMVHWMGSGVEPRRRVRPGLWAVREVLMGRREIAQQNREEGSPARLASLWAPPDQVLDDAPTGSSTPPRSRPGCFPAGRRQYGQLPMIVVVHWGSFITSPTSHGHVHLSSELLRLRGAATSGGYRRVRHRPRSGGELQESQCASQVRQSGVRRFTSWLSGSMARWSLLRTRARSPRRGNGGNPASSG